MKNKTILIFIAVALSLCGSCVCVLTLSGQTDVAGQIVGLGGFALVTLVIFGVPLAIVIAIAVLILKRKGIIR